MNYCTANINIRNSPEAEANDSGLRARTWTIFMFNLFMHWKSTWLCALVLQIVSVDLASEPIPFYRFSSVGPLVDPFHQVTANLGWKLISALKYVFFYPVPTLLLGRHVWITFKIHQMCRVTRKMKSGTKQIQDPKEKNRPLGARPGPDDKVS